MKSLMFVKHSGLVVMSAMSRLLCLLCLFYLIPVFMLPLLVLAPCTLPTWLVQGLVPRYSVAGTGGGSAPVLFVPKSQLASALQKSREVQRCSMRLAASQAASIQAYSKSTLSGLHHNFYKALPLTKYEWTCTETAQTICSLTEPLVLALKLWESMGCFQAGILFLSLLLRNS